MHMFLVAEFSKLHIATEAQGSNKTVTLDRSSQPRPDEEGRKIKERIVFRPFKRGLIEGEKCLET